MGDAPDKHKLFCPSCKQRLAVETHDLSGRVACPRCRASYALGELISERTTLDAVPQGAEATIPAPTSKYKLPCPKCGQKLAVETDDLAARIQCPRCRTALPLSELISQRTTIDAVPQPEAVTTAASVAGVGEPRPPAPTPVSAATPGSALLPPVNPTAATMIAYPPHDKPAASVGVVPGPPQQVIPAPQPSLNTAGDALAAPQSSPADTSNDSAAARGAAFDAAKRGVVATAKVTGSFLRFLYRVLRILYRVALWIDTHAHGHRAMLLTICLTVAASCNLFVEEKAAELTAVILFFALTVSFAVGRFFSWESEDQDNTNWNRGRAWESLKDLGGRALGIFRTIWDSVRTLVSPGKKNAARQRAEAVANLLGLVGPPAYLLGWITDSWLTGFAAFVLLGSILARVLRSIFSFFGPRLRVSVRDTGALAPVLDCVRDTEGARARARASGNQGIEELVEALCEWNPRRQDSEAGYQRSLARHLARNVSMEVSLEYTHRYEDKHCRFDILLGESVVVEMKYDLERAGDRDRAAGQVRRYAYAWKNGPILLVVCETSASFSGSLIAEEIRALHAQGMPVFAVAAGRRT
ncbi:MAG: hypothetical protein M0R80_22320 [Proteobacteria bacterium]|jgi:hypothetical protein|nr:hypothetical protein [Pseudomonadota bacterium]